MSVSLVTVILCFQPALSSRMRDAELLLGSTCLCRDESVLDRCLLKAALNPLDVAKSQANQCVIQKDFPELGLDRIGSCCGSALPCSVAMCVLHMFWHIQLLYIERGSKELVRIGQAIVNTTEAMDLALVYAPRTAIHVDAAGGR